MDLSTLPDLMQHFSIAVQFMPEFAHYVVEPVRNCCAAFGENSDYTLHEKFYHGSKFVALAGLLGFSLATWNIEGILGTAYAEADEINELYKKGWIARHPDAALPLPPA